MDEVPPSQPRHLSALSCSVAHLVIGLYFLLYRTVHMRTEVTGCPKVCVFCTDLCRRLTKVCAPTTNFGCVSVPYSYFGTTRYTVLIACAVKYGNRAFPGRPLAFDAVLSRPSGRRAACDLATLTLCATACVCSRLSTIVGSAVTPWERLAETKDVRHCWPLSARETLVHLRVVARLLRPFSLQPPAVAPQKLRCPWDPASACASQQLHRGRYSAVACTAVDDSAGARIHRIDLSARERAWLRWFGRFQDGQLLLETVRVGAAPCDALHLHDVGTGDCVACALQLANGPPLVHVTSASEGDAQRLCRAVDEFRHRCRLVRRLTVVDASREPVQRLQHFLRQLPTSVCRKVEALGVDGLPGDALRMMESDGSLPAVLVVEQARPKVSIGHAMDVMGSLVRQLVRYDNAVCDSSATAPRRSGETAVRAPGRRVHHVILVAAGRAATETLERAACSIAFKSHLALPRPEPAKGL